MMPKEKALAYKSGSGIVRTITRALMKTATIAAAVEGQSSQALLIEAQETRSQELEKMGLLSKGKK